MTRGPEGVKLALVRCQQPRRRDNLLTLKELGYPCIAVPSLSALEVLQLERFAYIKHVLIVFNNTPEAQVAARNLATSLGFKVRILNWPSNVKRDFHLLQLALEKGTEVGAGGAGMSRGGRGDRRG